MIQKQKLFAALFIFLGSLILASLCFANGVAKNQQKNLSTFLYHERPLTDEIVIVGLDDLTLSQMGSINNTHYATLLDNIQASEPSVVFFDILFSNSSNGIRKNELTSLAKEYPNVKDFSVQVLTYLSDPHPYDTVLAESFAKYDNVILIKHPYDLGSWNGRAFEVFAQTVPIDLFSDTTPSAFATVAKEEDSEQSGMIFAIPVRYEINGVEENHIDVQTAELYSGASTVIPQERGQMLINYAQGPESYPHLSFVDVYNNAFDPEFLKGKVIVVGATGEIYQDWHYTPMDSKTPMTGIEIHANAIQTILDEAFLVNQGVLDFALVLVVLLLASVLVFVHAPVLVGGAVLVLELIAFPFYAQWRFDHGVIVNLIWPVFALVAAYLAVLVYRNFTEFAEKRKLKEAFGRYVSPELVAQISEHPELLKLGGERRAITALFLDIENFTNLSESLEPQAVVSVINTYFDALSKVIMSKGGTVDKFEGDAIMALFGAPVSSEDHGLKGVETALAIREKMAELNASTGYKLNIRIGLATGDAIVGNMGSENRFDYTAMGDTVNTASRLEGANKFYSTRILVTEGTYEAAKGQFFMRQVDLVCLKGKDKAIRIYEVLGPLAGATEEGHKVVIEWDKALEAYRAGRFEEAEKGFRAVLATLPDDGPSKTLLGRIATLKLTALKDWDGVWKFESK